MRIVRFDSQERVDLPDMTQVSFLVLGEFRRQVRGILIGPKSGGGYDNFIIRGYKVEAQAVPDATIRVRLSLGGSNPLGFAIGSENLGSRVDAGQLMGGDDMAGNLEGNATQTLDFTGQPNGTYTVQMRFIYSDGLSDNRAFWNAGTNTEFIAATNTRHLPLIELRLSGSPSAEWITLASVVWGGVSIAGGNITDARTFAFEGTTPFQQTTQQGTGGQTDFSRSSDRGTNGFNEVYPALRALARQVQDIKGPDSSGEWNWWNRVFPPFDPGSALNAQQTKTMRSLETATYTVGDGATTFGDFNGVSGFDDCLAFLDAQNDTMAQCVTIILRSHAAAGFTWDVLGNRVLGTGGGQVRRVTIRGEGGGATFPAVTKLNFGAVTSGVAITLSLGTLELENIGNSDATEVTHNITMFQAPIVRAKNCRFYGRRTDGASSVAGVIATDGGDGSSFVNCSWRGMLQVLPGSLSDTVDEGILFDRCSTDSGCISLATFNSGSQSSIRNVRIQGCDIAMDQTHGWGLKGAIDLHNNNTVTVSDCRVVFCSDMDGVHGEVLNSVAPAFITVRDCAMGFSGTNPTHAVGSGGNGANGTGYCVYIAGSSSFPATGIHVDNCTFEGTNCVDGGGVALISTYHWSLSGNECVFCGTRDVSHTETFTGTLIKGTASNFNTKGAIRGCTYARWSATAVRTTGVFMTSVDNVKVDSCSFFGSADDESDITGRASTAVAIQISSCFYVGISNSHFENWEPNHATNSRCIRTNGGNAVRYLNITGCTFQDNGGHCLDLVSVQYGTASCNTVHVSVANGEGFSISACDGYVSNDNSFHFASGTKEAINFGAASNNVAMGNRAINGDIKKSSGTVRGYNEAGQDLNLVNAYS